MGQRPPKNPALDSDVPMMKRHCSWDINGKLVNGSVQCRLSGDSLVLCQARTTQFRVELVVIMLPAGERVVVYIVTLAI